jgi:FG-GAP repeat/RTX calcium-binding nonapeptide repeat (4 copies)
VTKTRDLGSLDGSAGVRLDGASAFDGSGVALAGVGDVNGDGYADLLIGASAAGALGQDMAGASFLVFGHPGAWAAGLDLGALDGRDGVRLDGPAAGALSGYRVSAAGDVNGDGFADLLIGAVNAGSADRALAGASYLVFGHGGDWAPGLDLGALDGRTGVCLAGAAPAEASGIAVAAAGDVNGDGFADVIIGAQAASPGGKLYAGASYLVFGHAGGWAANLDLGALDGRTGVRLDGVAAFDGSGMAVAGVGDVNGDGYADLLIGAGYASPDGRPRAGASYLVFGHAGGWGPSLDLGALSGLDGVRFDGATTGETSGLTVAAAGDVNGDGFADLLIGAPGAAPGGRAGAGATYLVFGHAGRWAAQVDLGALNGSNGVRFDGATAGDYSGLAVAGAGDTNGDGFADLLIGAYAASPDDRVNAGASYLIYGKAAGWAASVDLGTLGPAAGLQLNGVAEGDGSGLAVAAAGDINGDGLGDIVLGAPAAGSDDRPAAGASYLVFGAATAPLLSTGTAGADTLVGGASAETLQGLGGNDLLESGAGQDTLLGGGGFDTAIYTFPAAGALTHNPDGSWQVAKPGGSFDTLWNIERVQFSDGAVAIKLPNDTDANGDGLSDVLLQNATTGQVYVWAMSGTTLADAGYVGWQPGPSWRLAGAGDATGDGIADILLQNTMTGDCFLWALNGRLEGTAGLLPDSSKPVGWTPGGEWRAVGMGDTNADGHADIALQNTATGACYLWLLNGPSLASWGPVGWEPGSQWQARGMADFNGDGCADLALQNTETGDCYLWLLNGTTLVGSGFVGWRPPSAAWQLRDTGDYNGDGRADLLLQDATTGDCYVWLLDGTRLIGSGFVGWRPGPDWVVQHGGDFNGDGNSDVLLRNSATGESYVWLMDGLQLKGSGFIGWATSTDWHALG